MKTLFLLSLTSFVLLMSCKQSSSPIAENTRKTSTITNKTENNKMENIEKATLGAGCFWCVETLFMELKGVLKVESGYSGGKTVNPTYKEVCTGTTDHAEVVQITFDTTQISYSELLDIFWHVHDPTTLNRQGGDEGTQYRSVVYYHNDNQKLIAEKLKVEIGASGLWADPIVTEISPFDVFYKAEDYHQNYYNLNKSQSYCSAVIAPKVAKFRKKYADKLKTE